MTTLKRPYLPSDSGDFSRETKRSFVDPNSYVRGCSDAFRSPTDQFQIADHQRIRPLFQTPNGHHGDSVAALGPTYGGAGGIIGDGDGDLWMQDIGEDVS